MSVYMSEEEQIEIIKSWWKKYGNILIIGISLVLLAVAGFRYWNWQQKGIEQQASAIYERIMVALADGDSKQVQANAQRLVDDFAKTTYADAAQLTIAKLHVNNSDFDSAKKSLKKLLSSAHNQVFIDIARIRLARILIYQNQIVDAQKQLDLVKDKSLLPVVQEIKGDISIATGNPSEAKTFYQKAFAGAEEAGSANLFLEMKSKNNFIKTTS